jgi:hypothetical protein
VPEENLRVVYVTERLHADIFGNMSLVGLVNLIFAATSLLIEKFQDFRVKGQ